MRYVKWFFIFVKWFFHFGTFFIPLILWKIFKTSYEDKLKKISGVGDQTARDIINKFPKEIDLRNASAEQISENVTGVGIKKAKEIKSKI